MPAPGLCVFCLHSRKITSGRGSDFWLCGLAATNPRFPKYPALPVRECEGFADARSETDTGPASE